MVRLFRISGFAAFIAMMFLNAFVDLGHKIVIQNTVFEYVDQSLEGYISKTIKAGQWIPGQKIKVNFLLYEVVFATNFRRDRNNSLEKYCPS